MYENYGIEGLFMSEEQRKALPASASGRLISELPLLDGQESDKELASYTGERQDCRKT